MPSSIERASVCFRIGAPIWLSDERFAELLDLFDRHEGVTDEITFFTSETHPPLPIEVIEARAKVLEERIAAAHKRGYQAGINILATIGHHNENLANSLQGDYTPMTDPHGNVCEGSRCPNDPHMQAHITRLYEVITAAKPDYLWLDDDIRLYGHMPISCGCFCDTCLGLFAEECGTAYTRETLLQALNTGEVSAKLAVRRAWLQHNRETLGRLFRLIEKTVHAIEPGLPLGFMTGDRFFEGYDFDTWAEILAGPNKAEVLWRPGGGTYSDEWLDAITDKAHAIGRQAALLPTSITRIQSELESFPYQRLKKSEHATALEAAAYIAAGCTGTAFNVLSQYNEPLDEFGPLVAHLRGTRPFLDLLARTFERNAPAGVYTGWVKDSFAARNAVQGDWFAHGGPQPTQHCNELLAIGLPAAYHPSCAAVTALSGDSVFALTDEEVRAALSGGVYLDGPALTHLNALGYQDLTGFAISESRDQDCIEQLVGHPLNGDFGERLRNCRQSFWHNTAYAFTPAGNGSQVLSRLVDYTYQQIASCTMGVFENALGGRVCVGGYYPWAQLQNLSKSSQLKNVFRWLASGKIPGYITSFHRINLWIREGKDGALSAAVLNASLDPARDLTLALRTERTTANVFDPQCARTSVEASGHDGPLRTFQLPALGPWEMRLVTL